MPLVNVKVAEGVYIEKQRHDMAARLTDVINISDRWTDSCQLLII